MGERNPYEPGTFCWVGLATSDLAAARRFYADLFGWETPHWTSFISVEDADATAALAGELGGAPVFREPFDVLDAGRVAAIRDQTGAIVSLWQPRAHTGAGLVNEVGACCWNELATSDVMRATSFYGELLGWEYDIDAGGYATITDPERANAGIHEQTTRERGGSPRWPPYFSVNDVDTTARRATVTGGTGLEATKRTRGGLAALLADPQGAEFAVFEGYSHP